MKKEPKKSRKNKAVRALFVACAASQHRFAIAKRKPIQMITP